MADATVDIPRYVPLSPLSTQTKYWRVRANATDGTTSVWSSPFTYLLAAPANNYTIASGASLATIRSTLSTAIANTPALVTFAASGNYSLDLSGDPGLFMLDYSNVNDLIIDGNNALITIGNKPHAGFMRFIDSSRVTVRGFRIEYDPLPHSLADVLTVSPDTSNLDVRVRLRPVANQSSAYYPELTNNPTFTEHWSWAFLLDPANPGYLKKGVSNAFGLVAADATYIAGTSPREYRIYHAGSGSGKYFAPGDILAVVCRTNMGSFFSTTRSTDVTVESITCYASPMGNYYSYDGSDLKVLSCNTVLRDATRFMTANADGVHCRANPVGPWVENSTFIGNGDDGVALYNKGMVVQAKLSTSSLKVIDDYMNLKNGDLFSIFTPKQGTMLSSIYTVNGTPVNNGDGTYTVAFTPALTSTEYSGMTDVGLVDTQQNVQLFNASRRNDNFMVRNSLFTVRGRGAIVRSADGMIENNQFYGCSGPAVIFYNEAAQWFNGLDSRNVTIFGNDIQNCGFDSSLGLNAGAITVRFNKIQWNGTKYVDALAPSMPYYNMIIAGNSIKNYSQHGIMLANAVSSDLLSNIITSDTQSYVHPGNHYGIYVDTTDGISVISNDLSGEKREMTAPIYAINSTNYTESGNILPPPPIIKDNADSSGITITGVWTTGTAAGYYGTNYFYTSGGVGKSVQFTPTIPTTGSYEVYVRWVAASNRGTNVPVDVTHAGGTTTFSVNQQINHATWVLLGNFTFNAGTIGNVKIRTDGVSTSQYVVADAVKFVLAGSLLQPPAAPTNLTATMGDAQVSLTWTASSGADGYNVKRSTTSGGPYTAVATGVTTTSYTNTGLTNGTTYYYVVSAVNTYGESADSNEANATPQAPPSGTTMHVADIQVDRVGLPGGVSKAKAVVTIVDSVGMPVSNATVTVIFTEAIVETNSGVTDASGVVTITTNASAGNPAKTTGCVSNVTHSSLTYDAAANDKTCDKTY